MSGVMEGLRVLDLSWGTSGPMTTMLLADHGADVIRIERPGGAPFPEPQGYRVWNRGKRSAVLDLHRPDDVDTFLALAAGADIVVESFSPGTADRLGIGYDRLAAINPRLIYCAITGYGAGTRDADRPAIDQLVSARTGFAHEVRGWYGSPMAHTKDADLKTPDYVLPSSLTIGSERDGPIFTATQTPSVAAAYLATLGISAALHVRETTGVGQRVDTSLLQGIIQYQGCCWQRPDNLDAPMYQMDTVDRRQIWGFVQVKDRGWINVWGTSGIWARLAAEGDTLAKPDPDALAAAGGPRKVGTLKDQLAAFEEAVPNLRKFTRQEWTDFGIEGRFGVHPVRSPEEALTDDLCMADGSVAEIEDPELGVLRQAGILFRLHNKPTKPSGPAPARGQHTDEIRALAAAAGTPTPVSAAEPRHAPPSKGPLDGIKVLDFGFAVAGPWTSQVLGDMGADVLTIDAPGYHAAWPLNHMGMGVNKSKRHIILDIKNPAARLVLDDLLRSADVVTHNMRPGAAERLGLEYEAVRKINPNLVYLHTRAFEDGPRSPLGGHDQAGNALGGTVWEDGGCWNGGNAYFHVGTGGDLGNGFFGAIAVVQALYDRDRTGEGQKVDTSILNAALFCNSRVYTTREGKRFDRFTLDADQTGLNALYRLYECSSGWMCVAALTDGHWEALTHAVPSLADDARFATAADRRSNDTALASLLEHTFRDRTADEWFKLLDAAGVPVEVCSTTFSQTMFDDPELIARHWVVNTKGHPTVGDIDMNGIGIDFSETPSLPKGPPPMPGQHTREILAELGYDDVKIDGLLAAGAAATENTMG